MLSIDGSFFESDIEIGSGSINSLLSSGNHYRSLAVDGIHAHIGKMFFLKDEFSGSIDFAQVTFDDYVAIRETTVAKDMILSHAMIGKDALIGMVHAKIYGGFYADGINASSAIHPADALTGMIDISRSQIFGSVDFTGSRIEQISISHRAPDRRIDFTVDHSPASLPMAVGGRVSFLAATCASCILQDASFAKIVNFDSARITRNLVLDRSFFDGGISLIGTAFSGAQVNSVQNPEDGRTVLSIGGASFSGDVRLEWATIRSALRSNDGETWQQLHEIFSRRGDADGLLAVDFRLADYRARACGTDQTKIRCVLTQSWASVQDYLWGYGFLPGRVVCWEFLTWLLFAVTYYRLARSNSTFAVPRKTPSEIFKDSARRRLTTEVSESTWLAPFEALSGKAARKSWSVGFGIGLGKNFSSYRRKFQVLILLNYSLAKILLALFIISLAKSFPTLDAILKQAVPSI